MDSEKNRLLKQLLGSGRQFILLMLMLIGLGCHSAFAVSGSVAADGLLGTSLPAAFRPFSENSPWNIPISATADISPFSSLMIAGLKEQTAYLKADMQQWSVPLYVIDAASSPLRYIFSDEALHPSVDPVGSGVVRNLPIPTGVLPDPQKDGHLLLVDPVKRKSWDLSRAKPLPGGDWQVTRVAIWDLDGTGTADAFSGKRWWTFGARGSGMPLLAGLIRPEEIVAGEIHHALACALPNIRRALLPGGPLQLCSAVAARSDGRQDGPDMIPMGARLQLDPDLDLATLKLSPQTRVVALAMQRYGLYVSDGSPTFKLYLQNLGENSKRWGQLGDFSDLKNIPVEKFRVLECQIAEKGS